MLFNRISPMIYGRIKALVEEQLHVPVIGYVPELGFLQVGSRHLGLVLPDEIDGLKEQMERLADCMENTVDLDVLAMVCSGKEKWGNRVPACRDIVPNRARQIPA